MFNIALGLFLLLSPIFFLPIQVGNISALQFYQFGVLGNNGYNFSQLQFFQYGTIILFLISLLSRPLREFKDKVSVLLLGLFCLSVYFHPIGVKNFGNIFLGFMLYWLVVVHCKNYKKLLWILVVVSLLNTVFATLQFFGINLIYQANGRYDGLMLISTHLGVYQAMVLPICYVVSPWFAIIPIIGIALSKSVTAILIMFAWLIIRLRNSKFKISMPQLILILSGMVWYIIHNWSLILTKIDIRLSVWLPTVDKIWHKILGFGIVPFSLNSKYGLYENVNSIYLELIYILGVVALIPLFLIVKNILKSPDKVLVSSLMIALICGIEKSFLDYPRLAGTFIVLYGFLMISKGEKRCF